MEIVRNPTLQVGGANRDDGCDVLDFPGMGNEATHEGDIRGLWNPSDYPNVGMLAKVPEGYYSKIVVLRFCGRVEWIYQKELFAQFYQWLAPGGQIYVEDQNLPYVLRHYVKRRSRSKFPTNDHPTITNRDGVALQRWVNFQLYSGCSPGDRRCSIMDKHLLRAYLLDAGFGKVRVESAHVLSGQGQKPLTQKDRADIDFIP